MLPDPRAQFSLALLALLSPALCAAVDDPASRPPVARPSIGLLLPLNAPEFSRAAEAVRRAARRLRIRRECFRVGHRCAPPAGTGGSPRKRERPVPAGGAHR